MKKKTCSTCKNFHVVVKGDEEGWCRATEIHSIDPYGRKIMDWEPKKAGDSCKKYEKEA